jgi:hypothetical protein
MAQYLISALTNTTESGTAEEMAAIDVFKSVGRTNAVLSRQRRSYT